MSKSPDVDKDYRFETGRETAERRRYPASDLDRVPEAAIESFAEMTITTVSPISNGGR